MAELSAKELQTLFNAYVLFNNWGSMSPAQKSKAIMTLGLQGYRFATGKNLAEEFIVKPTAANGGEGLTFGQAFQLFGAGINAYSLSKNWKQMNDIQKIAGGAKFALDVGNTAKAFGLLGSGTQGTAAATATVAQLTQAGWNQASGYGVGAVTAPTGTQIPQGYTVISQGGDGLIAVPQANAPSAGGATTGGAQVANTTNAQPATGMSDYQRGVQGVIGAYNVYAGTQQGGVAGYGQAAAGGLQLAGAYTGSASYGGYAGAVMQGVGAYSDWTGGQYTDEQLAQQTQKRIGLAVGDAFTFGGASAFANVALSTPLGQKADKLYNKIDSKINPMTFLGGKAIGALGIGGKSKTKDRELKRLLALKEQGLDIPDAVFQNLAQQKGSSKADLIARAEATGGNVAFAKSRKESDLTPADILNSATFVEHDPNWFKRPLKEREQIAQDLINQGRIREHHGTIDADFEGYTPSGNVDPNRIPSEQGTPEGAGSPQQLGAQTARSQRKLSPDAKYLTQNAQKVYGGWINHELPEEGNGAIGGSQFVAGLSKMGKDNPYMSSAIQAFSLANEGLKKGTKESRANKRAILNALKKDGVIGEDSMFTLPDGTTSEMLERPMKFTNDYDYAAALFGISALELKSGKKGKGIADAGMSLGGAWLGNIPENATLMPETYTNLQANARAGWAKLGIASKADAYQLSNQAFAENRIDALDHHRLQRTADYIFDDNGYEQFQNNLGGKNRGIEVALEVSDRPLSLPTDGNIDPGRIPANVVGPNPSIDPGRIPANIAPQTSSPVSGMLFSSKDDIRARNKALYSSQIGMGG